jgi:hypothetical protein
MDAGGLNIGIYHTHSFSGQSNLGGQIGGGI